MCERCDARRASRPAMSLAQRHNAVNVWFNGLNRTNRRRALSMMFDVMLAVVVSPSRVALVASNLHPDSTEIDIAETVMDSYLSALELDSSIASHYDYETETDSNFYDLSEFLPTIH